MSIITEHRWQIKSAYLSKSIDAWAECPTREMRTMATTCPDCRDENHFCKVHQKYEKEVYESTRFRGKHDTQEFRMALHDARQRDLEETA